MGYRINTLDNPKSSVEWTTVPHIVPGLMGLKHDNQINHVRCGYNHSMVFSQKSMAYSWGEGSFGKLGSGYNR